jgi:hypothetical protein
MDIPGADYFYALAQVGITFSGFSALLIAVQQIRGVSLSGFHKWVARIFVQSGMVTTANAMLAPLFFGMGLTEAMTWRVSSVIIAISSVIRIWRLPTQWRTATKRQMDMRVKIHIWLIMLLNVGLLLNAIGWPFAPSGGLVMFTISWNLFAFFFQFAESVRFFFDEEVEEMDS